MTCSVPKCNSISLKKIPRLPKVPYHIDTRVQNSGASVAGGGTDILSLERLRADTAICPFKRLWPSNEVVVCSFLGLES